MNTASFESSLRERFWSLFQTVPDESLRFGSLDACVDEILEFIFLERGETASRFPGLPALRAGLINEVKGWGPLESLMTDTTVNEIMVNGPHCIYVERAGQIEKADVRFVDDRQLRAVVDRMVGEAGRRVDTSVPLCDVRLANGARVNVVLPPLSVDGPVITIRRFRPDIRNIDDLLRLGSLTENQAGRLRRSVEKRANILITGNSGSGKTTLLNALSAFIDPADRIITLEDAAELRLRAPHVIRLETRPKNLEGTGEISMAALVINALRMRPDRLVVGECRGTEVIPMLQAMNTGHDGSMATLHANSAQDAVRRLESLMLVGAPDWPMAAVRQQIASGLDVVVHLRRTGAERKLVEIGRYVFLNGDIHFKAEEVV